MMESRFESLRLARHSPSLLSVNPSREPGMMRIVPVTRLNLQSNTFALHPGAHATYRSGCWIMDTSSSTHMALAIIDIPGRVTVHC
jgi:hypothetical protein